MTPRILQIAVLILIITASAAGQQEKRAMTPADKVLLAFPSGAQLAPDGTTAAFTVRRADTARNRWVTQVHMTATESGETRQVTFGEKSCSDPLWSPDGRWLGFLSSRSALDRAGQRQEDRTMLFVLPASGGEARLLAAPPRDIDEYAWSPDGGTVALLTDAVSSPHHRAVEGSRGAASLNITVSSDVSAGKEFWLLDVSSGALRMVATLDAGAQSLAWFPDGKRLV